MHKDDKAEHGIPKGCGGGTQKLMAAACNPITAGDTAACPGTAVSCNGQQTAGHTFSQQAIRKEQNLLSKLISTQLQYWTMLNAPSLSRRQCIQLQVIYSPFHSLKLFLRIW
jgi:hypothetical protein